MTKTEKATQQMEAWAQDDSHGYDQVYRWGQYGDYDCSAAVISAWEAAGVPVKSKGASYTGNMLPVFLACGFSDEIVGRCANSNIIVCSSIVYSSLLISRSNSGSHTLGRSWGIVPSV